MDILGDVDRTGFKPEPQGYESNVNARQNAGCFQTQRNPLRERVVKI